ncbi:hypothetical protein ACFQJC_05520 [Haloferax namakaokahaiae]|uniref:Uncharacterized protein n=1 Tax=Haloferax namakaokahaiae TaxID=1748331 RepID=A0ABD5ZCT0_9EURY
MTDEPTPPRTPDPTAGEPHVLTDLVERWETVVEDAEAMAAEYAEDGWETLVLHPGDVTPMPPANLPDATDRVGFDVLVPGSEFDLLSEWVADADFDRYDVYRAKEKGVIFAVSAVEAPESEQVVLVPLYYGVEKVMETSKKAREQGELRLYVRPLEYDEHVELVQSEPSVLFP